MHEKPKYLTKRGTTYPLIYTDILWDRGDMVPCDEKGNPIEDVVTLPERVIVAENQPVVHDRLSETPEEPLAIEDDTPKSSDDGREARIQKLIAAFPLLKPEDYRKGPVKFPKMEPVIRLTNDHDITMDDLREAWSRFKNQESVDKGA